MVAFPCEAVQSSTFVCWNFFGHNFNIISDRSVQTVYFLFDSILQGCTFLEMCPFPLYHLICWHITVYSILFMVFETSMVSVVISLFTSLISLIWDISIFFLVILDKGWSILFIFAKSCFFGFNDHFYFCLYFNYFLIFINSFLLLILGFGYSSFF